MLMLKNKEGTWQKWDTNLQLYLSFSYLFFWNNCTLPLTIWLCIKSEFSIQLLTNQRRYEVINKWK